MTDEFDLREGLRGVPPGQSGVRSDQVATLNWYPFDGQMSLPLLSLDLDAYSQNRTAMMRICEHFAISIAPHAKTPMAPALAADLVEHGAWAISVADIRQAGVMLESGLNRILIANQIGGRSAIKRLAKVLSRYPEAEIYLFVDSAEFVEELASAWSQDIVGLPLLHLLVEVGCGRGGAHTTTQIESLVRTAKQLDDKRLKLAGVATYEGTANNPDPNQLKRNLGDLFQRVERALKLVRSAAPGQRLILTAGGSSLFDHVIVNCLPILEADGNCQLVLRCGAAFFCDHGPIYARLQAIATRGLLGEAMTRVIAGSFKPALRLWAEVLSVHDGIAICGLGLRDAAHDQGLPIPLRVWRDGALLAAYPQSASVPKLNDQHAFVPSAGIDLRPGDVVEFGISHPCTTIDKHQLIYGLDDSAKVTMVLQTFFG